MRSQRTFNVNNIAKNVNSLLSPDPISGIYILQERNQHWATVYVNYVTRKQGGTLFFCTTLYNVSESAAGRQRTAVVWGTRRLLWVSAKSTSSVKLSGHQRVRRPSRLHGPQWIYADVHRAAFQVVIDIIVRAFLSLCTQYSEKTSTSVLLHNS